MSETGSVNRTSPDAPGVEAIGASLDTELVQGIAWTGGAKWAAQVLTWASTLIVARILSPEDYGLVAMASVYMGVVSLVSEFGLGASVVNLRDLTEEQIAQLHGFAILTGLAGFVLSCVMAVPLGVFFKAPQLPAAVIVMSVAFVITGFRVVPASLLARDLRFRTLAVIDGARAAVMAFAMVLFAVLGFRYWTLVFGGVLSSLLYTTMTVSQRPQRVARPRRATIGHAMSFSLDVLISRISWYLYSNADFLVAGRVLGKDALGAYSMAWTLASVPVEKVSALVVRVTPSFFSAAQKDLAAMRRYLVVLTEGIALLTLPAALGIALVTDDFIRVVLTEKWLAAILPLRLLALYAVVRSVSPLFAPVLMALNRTRAVMWNNILALVLLPTAFYIGSRWGTAGIAAGWMVAHPIVVGVIGRETFRAIELPLRRYLAALWPAASAAALMVGVVLGTRVLLPDGAGPPTRLFVEVSAGAAAYVLALLTWHRERVRSFRLVYDRLRGRKSDR